MSALYTYYINTMNVLYKDNIYCFGEYQIYVIECSKKISIFHECISYIFTSRDEYWKK